MRTKGTTGPGQMDARPDKPFEHDARKLKRSGAVRKSDSERPHFDRTTGKKLSAPRQSPHPVVLRTVPAPSTAVASSTATPLKTRTMTKFFEDLPEAPDLEERKRRLAGAVPLKPSE